MSPPSSSKKRPKSTSPPPSESRTRTMTPSGHTTTTTTVSILSSSCIKVLLLASTLLTLYYHTSMMQESLTVHSLNLRKGDQNSDGILDVSIPGMNQDASIDDHGVPVTLTWNDLSVQRMIHPGTVQEKLITTVRPNSGSMVPGEITAIMGGSGSGKSTLLRALMGRQDDAEITGGSIQLNGKDVTRSPEFFANVVGFVPQEDVMHDDFSIEENLQFSAEWRLDQEIFSLESRRGIVDDVLSRLGISQWRHDRVGRGSDTDKSHVSGGQKKRVNIGIELVADPGILFLDEPTSGLDSATTWKIISELKATSINASLPIAAVLHQPSDKVFSLFTTLLLMARGGNVIYHGPCHEAVKYFSTRGFQKFVDDYSNPADFLMDIVEGIIEPDCTQDSVRCFNYNFLEHPYQWWRVERERRAKLNNQKDSTLQAAAAKKAAAKKAATAEAAGTGIGTTTEQDLLLISKATSFQQQLRLFFYRSMYLLKKSTGTADIFLVSFVATLSAVSCAKLIQKFGVNLVAASLANQAVALGASMVAVVMAIPEFETERLMFERERNVGLNV